MKQHLGVPVTIHALFGVGALSFTVAGFFASITMGFFVLGLMCALLGFWHIVVWEENQK